MSQNTQDQRIYIQQTIEELKSKPSEFYTYNGNLLNFRFIVDMDKEFEDVILTINTKYGVIFLDTSKAQLISSYFSDLTGDYSYEANEEIKNYWRDQYDGF